MTLKNKMLLDWFAKQGCEDGQGPDPGFMVSSIGALGQVALTYSVRSASHFRCTTCLSDF